MKTKRILQEAAQKGVPQKEKKGREIEEVKKVKGTWVGSNKRKKWREASEEEGGKILDTGH